EERRAKGQIEAWNWSRDRKSVRVRVKSASHAICSWYPDLRGRTEEVEGCGVRRRRKGTGVVLSQLGDICVQSLLDALVSVVRELAAVDYEPSEERGAFRWEAVPGNWSGLRSGPTSQRCATATTDVRIVRFAHKASGRKVPL